MSDLFALLKQRVEQMPDHPVFQYVDTDRAEVFTTAGVASETARISLFLYDRGIRAGDAVGILMENHPRWGIACLAAHAVGARVVPLDILHDNEMLARLIQHAECKFLISSAKLAPKLADVQELLPEPLGVLLNGRTANGYASWEHVLESVEVSATLPLAATGPDDPFLIIYTSGTTGAPRGVVLTRRNVFRTTTALSDTFDATPRDHMLCILPLFHVMALMANFIVPFFNGGRVTYLDSVDGQRILNAFRDQGITMFICVPQFYYVIHRKILREIRDQSVVRRMLFRRMLALSHFCNERLHLNPGRFMFRGLRERFGGRVRLFGVGGASFDPDVAKFFRDLGCTIVQGYGLTETASLATLTPPGPQFVGSVGRPLPHMQIRIDVPDDEGVGEVLIRGESLMLGYWKDPAATAEAIQEGWLRTGDLGYIDRQGCLHITGRKKELVVLSNGKKVFPEELEHFYQRHAPHIQEMCVLGIGGSRAEPDVKLHAVVVPDFEHLKRQRIVNARDAVRFELERLSQQLPPYRRITTFEIRREPLPRTTTRKLRRLELAESLQLRSPAACHDEAPSVPSTLAEGKVLSIVRQMKPGRAVHRKMHLELDLGFDSLERVELWSAIRQAFGEIPDEQTGQTVLVEDVVNAVEEYSRPKGAQQSDARPSWKQILSEPLLAHETPMTADTLLRGYLSRILTYAAARLVLYTPAKLLFRAKVVGLNCLPRDYPFMICPNHLSFLDPFLIAAVLPYHATTRLIFLGDASYFAGSVMGRVARWLKVVPVDPGRGLRQALRLAAEGLRKGCVLCVFPEGERSVDGAMKPFRKGPAILARELGVAVVPAAVAGTHEIWPMGKGPRRLNPVTVRFGAPLRARENESYDDFNKRLDEAVRRLAAEDKTADFRT
jgi:long-chain acyl-CoA synthetase